MQKEDHYIDAHYGIPEDFQKLLEGLDEMEQHIVECIFQNRENLYHTIKNIEDALTNDLIQERDIQNLHSLIIKLVSNKSRPNKVKKKPSLVRAFFELPEMIHDYITKHGII
jgi:hypothetical protein